MDLLFVEGEGQGEGGDGFGGVFLLAAGVVDQLEGLFAVQGFAGTGYAALLAFAPALHFNKILKLSL